MKLSLTFLLFLFLICPALALVNSKPVPANKFSAVVSIKLADTRYSPGKEFCSGVLINSKQILTAGHCIEAVGQDLYDQPYYMTYHPELVQLVVAGKNYKVKAISYALSYFDYDDLKGEDIALVELELPVIGVTPIRLLPSAKLKTGLKVELVARGKVAQSQIKSISKYNGHSVVAIDGKTTGVCAGDSGGGLFVETAGQYYLAGILAADEGACTNKDSFATFPSMKFDL